MIWILDFFQSGATHSPNWDEKMFYGHSTGQDLSNDTNFVNIGRWEPSICGRQKLGDKKKNIHI
jgi:hypothetical protein